MRIGNRRRRRDDYLLDVKVQTQGRWRHRARVTTAAVAVVVVFALTCYGMYRLSRYSLRKLVYENPRFALAQIVVENDGALAPERVAQLAGVRVGVNLFSLDLGRVQRNLEMVPLIRGVEVRRVLPDRLYIHVDERMPVARLQGPSRELTDETFLVDRTGMVMKPLRLADGTVLQPQTPRRLPLLTGVTLADVRVGRQVESELIYRALDLLDRVEQSRASALFEVEQIDLSKPRVLVVSTRQPRSEGGGQAVLRFDMENFSQQLRRLGVILSWAQQRQKVVQMVDLTVDRSVPVTFAN
jgi:cell division septal protein FtsQ